MKKRIVTKIVVEESDSEEEREFEREQREEVIRQIRLSRDKKPQYVEREVEPPSVGRLPHTQYPKGVIQSFQFHKNNN
jgi:hypothetical protein